MFLPYSNLAFFIDQSSLHIVRYKRDELGDALDRVYESNSVAFFWLIVSHYARQRLKLSDDRFTRVSLLKSIVHRESIVRRVDGVTDAAVKVDRSASAASRSVLCRQSIAVSPALVTSKIRRPFRRRAPDTRLNDGRSGLRTVRPGTSRRRALVAD